MTYEELCKSNEPSKIDMVVTEQAAEEKSMETIEETTEATEEVTEELEVEVKADETEEVELKVEETEEVELELVSDDIELKGEAEVDTDAIMEQQEMMIGLVSEATEKLTALNGEVETLKQENADLQDALKTFISDTVASAAKSLFRR